MTYKDGTVALEPYDPNEPNWFFRWLGKLIVDVTKKPYTHTAWFFGGYWYDDTVWRTSGGKFHSGIRRSLGSCPIANSVLLVPDTDISESYSHLGEGASEMMVDSPDNHYGYFHLILLAITYPTRWFWNRIGWTPFEHVVRQVCSTAPVYIMRITGRDPFPGKQAEDIAPGDWLDAEGWHRA